MANFAGDMNFLQPTHISPITISLACLFAVQGAQNLALTVCTTVFPFYLIGLGATASDLGVVQAAFSCTVAISFACMGPASDAFGRKPIFLAGLWGLSIFTYFTLLVDTVKDFCLAAATSGLFYGFAGAAEAYLSDALSPTRYV